MKNNKPFQHSVSRPVFAQTSVEREIYNVGYKRDNTGSNQLHQGRRGVDTKAERNKRTNVIDSMGFLRKEWWRHVSSCNWAFKRDTSPYFEGSVGRLDTCKLDKGEGGSTGSRKKAGSAQGDHPE